MFARPMLSFIGSSLQEREDNTMSRRHQITALAVAGLLALAPAFARNQGTTAGSQTAGAPRNEGTQSQGSTQRQGSGQLTSQDQKFVMEAAQGSMMEVELGRLASQKATNADVKAFAQRMVTDHGKASDQLEQVVSQKGVTLPTTLPQDMSNEMDKLSRASGAEFDRMYMSEMVKHHRKDVSEFEKQAERGGDPAVRAFAQQTLPTLREHLRLAQDLASRVGANVSEDHSGHGTGKKSGS
jgi:putative membrane protein